MTRDSLQLRETLFGDVPLATWAAAASDEPWSSFAKAAALLERADRAGATDALQSIVKRSGLASRHYLQAWSSLRALSASPPAAEAKHVYGVVVDVPVDAGLDTLAGYEDGTARYLNASGAAIVWDVRDARIGEHVEKLLSVGSALASRIGPWNGARPPLPAGQARISLLTPSGLHFGQAPLAALSRDAMAIPLFTAARELMNALIRASTSARKPT